MRCLIEAPDWGPLPLELPVGPAELGRAPRDPEANRSDSTVTIEIDLVSSDDDGDVRTRGGVIEIDLA